MSQVLQTFLFPLLAVESSASGEAGELGCCLKAFIRVYGPFNCTDCFKNHDISYFHDENESQVFSNRWFIARIGSRWQQLDHLKPNQPENRFWSELMHSLFCFNQSSDFLQKSLAHLREREREREREEKMFASVLGMHECAVWVSDVHCE